ncbi:hypothetical protein DPEC_G00214580 [Dallia pectoralis]|uniref:Uncharacterized protein n=1 Tax=Dallia pectoralis TaxID=75939 RepID=A0ACC2G1Q8_DALPE|nr:hypothetical protein DPEC_G00214580 [Dallia pectoralis]
MSEYGAEMLGVKDDERNVQEDTVCVAFTEISEPQLESSVTEEPHSDAQLQDSDAGGKTEPQNVIMEEEVCNVMMEEEVCNVMMEEEVCNVMMEEEVCNVMMEEEVSKSTFLTVDVNSVETSAQTFLTADVNSVETSAQTDILEEQEALPKKASFSNDVGNSTATVKIMLMPEGHTVTMAFAIGLSIKELKLNFANELKVPPEVIQISLSGGVVEDHRNLMELGVLPHSTIQLEMTSSDPDNHPIRPMKPQQDYNMPDVLTVRVQTDSETDTFQDVVVEIERFTRRKAFLGGYRHKATGTEYHHAAVQTTAKKKPDSGVETFSRDTQTVTVRSQSQQCTNNTSTQMTMIGCYMSNAEDKLITPGSYITAAQYHARRLRAVITLQTYTRRWQAKKMTDHLREDRDLHVAWMEEEERRKKQEKEEHIKAEYHRRMNPESRGDFALLYSALEKWKRDELEQINGTLEGADRKAALCRLLDRETQLIASIGRHEKAAGERNHDKAVQMFLEKCASPKRWRAFDGKMTQMDTQNTIRAKELKDLYTSINLQYFSQEERLDVLLTLKHTVKEDDCKLTRNILELIAMETDLMKRGVKESNLVGLRKRISTLFLQYIKTPFFNPEAAKLLKVPLEPPKLKQKYSLCTGCSRYLKSTDFALTVDASLLGQCRSCSELDIKARRRDNLSHYKTILSRLRKTEVQRNKEAKISFLLQEQDMKYLVDVVWGAQSALSAWSDMHDLVMVRWEGPWEWSPWNCVLLNSEEAAAHNKVEDKEKLYGVEFIRSVKHKHTLAKNYFSQIPVMAQYLKDVDSKPAAHCNFLVAKPSAR